jgi:hypothetical protein
MLIGSSKSICNFKNFPVVIPQNPVDRGGGNGWGIFCQVYAFGPHGMGKM